MKRICSVLTAATLCLSLCAPALAADEGSVHASMRNTSIIIDGGEDAGLLCAPGKRVSPITYNGTVYVPLYTAGLWLGADAAYDRNAGAVFIVSNGTQPVRYSHFDFNHMDVGWQLGDEQMRNDGKKGVYVQPLPDVTVTVNGQPAGMVNALGEPVCPLLFRENVYLPVRSVAGWMGKQVQWVRHGRYGDSDVHIFDAPTQAEVDNGSAYVAAVREHTNAVRALLEGTEVHTEEEFASNMRVIQAHLKAVMELPLPEFPSLARQMKFVPYNAADVLLEKVDGYLPEGEKSGAEEFVRQFVYQNFGYEFFTPVTWQPEKEFLALAPEGKWAYIRDIFLTEKEFFNPWFLSLEEKCGSAETLMAAVTAAQPTV